MKNDTTEVCCVGSLSEALRLTAKSEFCLVILDLQLSGIKILEMVRIIRVSQQAPILALTDPLESNQEIALYHAGVNALMEKPVRAEVCMAQAESLIQLCLQNDEGEKWRATLAFGESLVICPRFWQVFVNGELLELTKKEFELLHFFARRPRQVFSREQLFDQIWDYKFEFGTVMLLRITLFEISPYSTNFATFLYQIMLWNPISYYSDKGKHKGKITSYSRNRLIIIIIKSLIGFFFCPHNFPTAFGLGTQ